MNRIVVSVVSRMIYYTGMLEKIDFGTQILMYHRIVPEHFKKQIEYLSKNYKIVGLQEANENLDKKQLVLTFDDGYRNNYLYAYPILKEFGLRATIFIVHDFIDKNIFTWWDRLEFANVRANIKKLRILPADAIEKEVHKHTGLSAANHKPPEYDFMSWKEVKQSADIFDIGSHTLTHPCLTESSYKEAATEVVESKKKIEDILDRPVVSFAYPYGESNEDVFHLVETAGYRCAVLSEKGNNKNRDPFQLRRRDIEKNNDVFVIANKLSGLF